jgi:hypothetical protein
MNNLDRLMGESSLLVDEINKKHDLVIYSACFGDIDDISSFVKCNESFAEFADFVLFTDLDVTIDSKINVIKMPNNLSGSRMTAKAFKVLPHRLFREYSSSLWIDANMTISRSSIEDIGKLKGHLMTTFKHNKRDYVYQEAIECVIRGKDSLINIIGLMTYLYKKNYYKQTPLRQCRWLLRRHNDKSIVLLMENWWKLIQKYSIRDQLSLPFCIWKGGVKINILSHDKANFYFNVNEHLTLLSKGNGISALFVSFIWKILSIVKLQLFKQGKKVKK